MGNRRNDTAANRAAATGADVWEGLEWYETDTGLSYIYRSGAWVVSLRPPTFIPITTFGTNWTGGTGAQVPGCYISGNRVDLVGSVLIGASGGGGGYSNILTVPASCQPPTTGVRFIGVAATSTAFIYALGLTSGVLSSVAGYATGSLGFSTRTTLNCFWFLD